MSKIGNVRLWTDAQLLSELRSVRREELSEDMTCANSKTRADLYLPLIVEALARLLEKQK